MPGGQLPVGRPAGAGALRFRPPPQRQRLRGKRLLEQDSKSKLQRQGQNAPKLRRLIALWNCKQFVMSRSIACSSPSRSIAVPALTTNRLFFFSSIRNSPKKKKQTGNLQRSRIRLLSGVRVQFSERNLRSTNKQ